MVRVPTASAPFSRHSKAVLSMSLLLLFVATTLYADRRGTGKRRGAPPPRTSVSVTTPHQPTIPRRLLPPAGLGSAANVPSGFYRKLDAPQPRHGGGGGGGVPNVVYVYPFPGYNVAPIGFDNSSSPSRATNPNEPVYAEPPRPQPQPQPIFVTRERPADADAGQAPQPVYIVERPEASPPQSVEAAPPAAPPTPKKASPVAFDIQPADAVAYLDDDRLGDGESLATLLDGLVLEPGVHVLEVSHPDYKTQRLVFGVGSGEPMEVVVDLAAKTPQRRSRVR